MTTRAFLLPCLALAGALSLPADEPFRMMNVLPYSPGEEARLAREAADYAAQTGFREVLYCLTCDVEGAPAAGKVDELCASFRRFRDAPEAKGLGVGVLLQAIVGHWPHNEQKTEPWTRTRGVGGGEGARRCVLDPRFAAYVRETAAKIAREKPAFILGDDDIRPFSYVGEECCCELHAAAFAKRTGRAACTSEEMRRIVKDAVRGSKDERAFRALQREAVNGVCRLIREGIDSVDPGIESGVCLPMAREEPRFYGQAAKAIAGAGRPTLMRVGNGQYLEREPRQTVWRVLSSYAIAELHGDVDWLLDEADTYPQTLWSRSAVGMHAKICMSELCGFRGALPWYVGASRGKHRVNEAYTRIIAANAGLYRELARIGRATAADGVAIPLPSQFPAADSPIVEGDGWGDKVCAAFGVPFRCTRDFSDRSAVRALAGETLVARLSDAELRELLSGRLLVDGAAAEALTRRGFAQLLGVRAGVAKKPAFVCELAADGTRLTLSSGAQAASLSDPDPGAGILTHLANGAYSAAPELTRVAPATTVFTNALGGVAAVTAWKPTLAAGFGGGPLNEARRQWFLGVLEALGGARLPFAADHEQDVLVQARAERGGRSHLLLVGNLGYDPIAKIRLRCAARPRQIHEIGGDGVRRPVDFAWADGVAVLERSLPCYGVAALVAVPASPLDDLLPRPRQVEVGVGTADAGALDRVRTVRAAVAGAPAAVADEAYALEISSEGVRITASDARGERWARVTLDQLRALSRGRAPCCRIVDWPALKWRGFMNDCGRNYLDFAAVKACVDTMAKYKMNLFHWHLSDYHGWRLESKKYPQLQRKEAFLRQVGKFYTQAEFRELVAYAAARGVTVMPELDVPGHTLALRRGLGIETMSAPGTDRIVDDLFAELCGLAPADVMPFVHLGTDEVRVKPEYCDDAWVSKWARTVNRLGRKAVVWAPGKRLDKDVEAIDMAWYDNHITNSVNPAFDAARMYNGSWCPFAVAPRAAFTKACRWQDASGRQIGAITCTWHDDNCGDDNVRLFRDAMVLPSIVAFADNYWSGRTADHAERWQRLPPPGDPLLDELTDLERRLAVHRDAFFADFAYPFPFLRQTHMRWRLTDDTGAVLAREAPQAWFALDDDRGTPGFTTNTTGCATAEAWIESPADVACGAWIDFTCFGSAYGRTSPTPDLGEWNKHGARIFLNGAEIPPPKWIQPNMRATTPRVNDQDVPWTDDLLDKPFADEGCARREPTPIVLRKGINVVKLVMPKKPGGSRWIGLFSPLLGTSAHPREVPGLVWRAPPLP